MAIPTATKSWTITQTRLYERGTATAASQQALRAIKDALLSAGWTCLGSQTAAAGGMDGVDRWTTDAALKWGNASSDVVIGWIVLRRANASGVGQHLDLLIRLSSSTTFGTQVDELSWYWATGGAYVGGSTTARPTYAGGLEVAALTTAEWRDNGPVDFGGLLTTIRAADGSIRVFLLSENQVRFFASVEVPATPAAGWTHPLAVTRVTGSPGYASAVAASATFLYDASAPASAAWVAAYWATEGYSTTSLGASIRYGNQILGGPNHEYALAAVDVASIAPGKAGVHGRLADLYAAPAHLPIGWPLPAAGGLAWVKLGDALWPWDGTPIRTA